MTFKPTGLDREMKKLKTDLNRAVSQFKPSIVWRDVGKVTSVYPGVAYIEGLTSARAEEIIEFENGETGIVFNIDEEQIGCVLLCDSKQVKAGMEVASTGKIANTIVGEELLGRVIDPIGKLLDQKGPLLSYHKAPIEGDIPDILDRTSVKDPLETGIKTIDTLVPIGKGQRQLILGDRQTGKTSIALDTIINQKNKNVICIYCAIGQRSSSVASSR